MPGSAFSRPYALSGASQALSATAGYFCGASIRETAGAVAVVRIWDNASAASGTLLATLSFAANQSIELNRVPPTWAANGVYVEKVSGTIEGSVFIG